MAAGTRVWYAQWLMVAALTGSAFAMAGSPASSDPVLACYHNSTGSVRLVEAASDCRRQETFTSWAREGPGGPPGTAGQPCWDLDGNGMPSGDEDTNGDGSVDVLDCRSASGPASRHWRNDAGGQHPFTFGTWTRVQEFSTPSAPGIFFINVYAVHAFCDLLSADSHDHMIVNHGNGHASMMVRTQDWDTTVELTCSGVHGAPDGFVQWMTASWIPSSGEVDFIAVT